MAKLTTAVFDLGGVVLRWDPRAAYADAAGPDEIERFMTEVGWQAVSYTHLTLPTTPYV